MTRNRFTLGGYYECERCGNRIKVIGEGGGHIICCVKAMIRTEPPEGEPRDTGSGAFESGGSSGVLVAQGSSIVDPGSIDAIDVFGVSDDRGEEKLKSPFLKPLFQFGSSQVEILRLLYGQDLTSAPRPNQESTLVLMEGRGVFVIGGKEHRVTPGATVLVPRGSEETIKNTMPDEMLVVRILSSE